MAKLNRVLDTLIFLVNELMFPKYLLLGDVQLLCMTSKMVQRKFDAHKEIVCRIANTLGLPIFRPPSKRHTQYATAKLSTIFKARAIHLSHRVDNPVKFKRGTECLRNWSGDYANRLGECCEGCFRFIGDGKTSWHQMKTQRVTQDATHVSYKIRCTDCSPL